MGILVVGGSGFLGQEVVRRARDAGPRVVATFHSRASPIARVDWQRLDIRDRDGVTALVARTRPAVLINTAFDQADWATTADGGMHVAAAAVAVGARLVHVSSDAVFSGRAGRYDETSPPDPTTPYGAAKAAAETAIKGLDPAAVIARTSLIIGYGESRHERYVHALAAGATTGVLFTDDVRCPVHVTDLASALLELAGSRHSGVHHVAGADAVSRHELGVRIARRDGLDEASLPTGLRAGTGLPGAAEIRLDCAMTQSRLTTRLRGAREFLATTPAGSAGPRGADDLSYSRIVPSLVAAVPELRPALAVHVRDNGEVLQHVFVGCAVVPFVLAAWRAGDAAVVGRCLAVLEAALACPDGLTRELVSVSFVEQVGPWEPAMRPFVETWPPALAREARLSA